MPRTREQASNESQLREAFDRMARYFPQLTTGNHTAARMLGQPDLTIIPPQNRINTKTRKYVLFRNNFILARERETRQDIPTHMRLQGLLTLVRDGNQMWALQQDFHFPGTENQLVVVSHIGSLGQASERVTLNLLGDLIIYVLPEERKVVWGPWSEGGSGRTGGSRDIPMEGVDLSDVESLYQWRWHTVQLTEDGNMRATFGKGPDSVLYELAVPQSLDAPLID